MKFNPPDRFRQSCSPGSVLRRKALIGFAAAAVVLTAAACAMPSTASLTMASGSPTSLAQTTDSSSPSAAAATQAPASPQLPTTQAPPPPPPTTAAPAAPVTPDLCGAPQNPYGYNFCGDGGYIYSPASGVCGYFDCIDNFWNGRGRMEECSDGTFSMSGGISGACSDHGGEEQAVYSG